MGNGFSVTDPLQLSSAPGVSEQVAANPQIGLIRDAIESIPVLSRGEKAVNAIIAATRGGRKRVVHHEQIHAMAASRALESQKGRSKKNGMKVSIAGGCSDCGGTCKTGGYNFHGDISGPRFDRWSKMVQENILNIAQAPGFPMPAPEFETGRFAPKKGKKKITSTTKGGRYYK